MSDNRPHSLACHSDLVAAENHLVKYMQESVDFDL